MIKDQENIVMIEVVEIEEIAKIKVVEEEDLDLLKEGVEENNLNNKNNSIIYFF